MASDTKQQDTKFIAGNFLPVQVPSKENPVALQPGKQAKTNEATNVLEGSLFFFQLYSEEHDQVRQPRGTNPDLLIEELPPSIATEEDEKSTKVE